MVFEPSQKVKQNQYINPNLVLHQFLNIFSDYDSSFHVIENSSQITDFIKCLDSTPVYFTFNCGILYIPNKSISILKFRFKLFLRIRHFQLRRPSLKTIPQIPFENRKSLQPF